jgi:hypothetical protein
LELARACKDLMGFVRFFYARNAPREIEANP